MAVRGMLQEEDAGYKEYRFAPVQAGADWSTDQALGEQERCFRALARGMGQPPPQKPPLLSHRLPPEQGHLAGDKTCHGQEDGVGVGGICQSPDVGNQWTVQDASLGQVCLSPGCNMCTRQNLNRKCQGRGPEEERGVMPLSTHPSKYSLPCEMLHMCVHLIGL